jgi:amino acid transporter
MVAMEKKKKNKVIDSLSISPDYEMRPSDSQSGGFISRMVDSFKRDPFAHATSKDAAGGGKLFDVGLEAAATAESPLARKLKGRNLQMIAIGGSIGMLGVHRTRRERYRVN